MYAKKVFPVLHNKCRKSFVYGKGLGPKYIHGMHPGQIGDEVCSFMLHLPFWNDIRSVESAYYGRQGQCKLHTKA